MVEYSKSQSVDIDISTATTNLTKADVEAAVSDIADEIEDIAIV